MFALKTNRSRVTAIAGAAALIAGGIVGLTGTAAEAAALTYVASPVVGPGNALGTAISGTNPKLSVTITGKGFRNAAGTALWEAWAASTSSGVQIATNCGTTLATIVGNVTNNTTDGVLAVSAPSAIKMVVSLGDIPLVSSAKTAYKICVYSDTGSAGSNVLLGSAAFTAYPKPTYTAVTPAAGPLWGGQTVAIDGTNFTSTSTVKVGTVAATNVKFIDSTSLTATIPANTTAGTQNIVVTNEGGSSIQTHNYTYTATVNVSPASAPAAAGTTITVRGSGFLSPTWGAVATPTAATGDAGAYIMFILGNTAYSVGGANTATAYCQNVVVENDTTLTCDTPTLTVGKAYEVFYVSDGTSAVTATSVSSGSTFTAAAF